ncbi:MAG: hypothetical protein O7I42_10880 [Alphaproteobacteria bacterium]|nr:hypothetical protein [Alphaproteobacteria bacterium]
MITNFAIYSAANIIAKQYGKDARLHATKRATAMLKAGDLDSYAVWKRILRAVEELQGKDLGPGMQVH